MKRKVIKKVIGLLFPILTLFILSACNNRVDRDLAKTAISNIRSVVEAAGLEAEGSRLLILLDTMVFHFT